MKNLLLIAVACCLALSAYSQSKKPAKVGLSSEFTGKFVSVYQYDFRQNFTIVDSKDGKKVDFYLMAGMNDRYQMDYDIPEELYQSMFGEEGWKGVRVKVYAKSTYAEMEDMDTGRVMKSIVWRAVKVVRL